MCYTIQQQQIKELTDFLNQIFYQTLWYSSCGSIAVQA